MPRTLVYGCDHLAFRIIEQLRRDGSHVSVIAARDSWLASAAARLPADVRVLPGSDADTPTVLLHAEVSLLDALFVVSDKDEDNLSIALAALEINPQLRVVLRQFNVRLGKLLAEYLPRCEVLSMSTLAAPTFAVAALTPGVVHVHAFAEQLFVVHEIDFDARTPDGVHLRLSPQTRIIACHDEGADEGRDDHDRHDNIDRTSTHTFPPSGVTFKAGARLLVATLTTPEMLARDVPPYPNLIQAETLTASSYRIGYGDIRRRRILLLTLGYLAFVVTFGALYFSLRLQMSALDAVYFVVTTITSVGFGDFNLRESDALSKVIGILMMISGVGVTAVLFALVTNGLLTKQQALDKGQVRHSLARHTIVCGLGVVGLRVASVLRGLRQPVIVVERDEDSRFVREARRQGIPLVIGDALQEQTLIYANLAKARALIVCANPDHLNLEIALHARSLNAHLPIVLRMFDPDLSRRVTSHFDLGTTLSSANLVANYFATHASDANRLFRVQYHDLTIEVRRINLSEGETVEACRRRHGGNLIAIGDVRGQVRLVNQDADNETTDVEYLLVASVSRSAMCHG